MQPHALLAVGVVMTLVFIGGTFMAITDQKKSGKPAPDPSTIKVDWATVFVSLVLMAGTLYGVFTHHNGLMYGGGLAIVVYYFIWLFIQRKKAG